MKSNISPSIEEVSAHPPSIFTEKNDKVLECNLERVFINPLNRRSDEHVFLLSQHGGCILPEEDHFPQGVSEATKRVRDHSAGLCLASLAVGRLFVQFTGRSRVCLNVLGDQDYSKGDDEEQDEEN